MKQIILALNGIGIVIAHLIGAINTIIGMYKSTIALSPQL